MTADLQPERRCFVLTGGPGVGKTTLIDHLGSLGFATVREAARDVIEEQALLGSDVLPWRNQSVFQRHVFNLQLEREATASGPIVFMDRGIPDGVAYLRAYGLSVFRDMLVQSRARYDGVFLVEPHGVYADDPQRRENSEQALILHKVLGTTYRDLGYELIIVPAMSVTRRARFVVDRVFDKALSTETKGLG